MGDEFSGLTSKSVGALLTGAGEIWGDEAPNDVDAGDMVADDDEEAGEGWTAADRL